MHIGVGAASGTEGPVVQGEFVSKKSKIVMLERVAYHGWPSQARGGLFGEGQNCRY